MVFIPEWAFVKREAKPWCRPSGSSRFVESELVCSPRSPGQWTQEAIGVALSLLRRRPRHVGQVRARPEATGTWQVMGASEFVLDEC